MVEDIRRTLKEKRKLLRSFIAQKDTVLSGARFVKLKNKTMLGFYIDGMERWLNSQPAKEE